MAVKFLEPGGDATFNVATTTNGGFWQTVLNSPTVVTDFVHGAHVKSIISETGQITLNNVTSNIALTSTPTVFTAFAGSTIYPAGTGTDIGMNSAATATTVSLYECGVVVAFFPPPNPGSFLQMFK